MKKAFLLKVPVWDTVIFISIGQSDKEFQKFLDSNFDLPLDFVPVSFDHDKTREAVSLFTGDGDALGIRLRGNPKKNFKYLPGFNHELSHLIQLMLNYRGLQRSMDSEEAYAYTTSYLTAEIFKQL